MDSPSALLHITTVVKVVTATYEATGGSNEFWICFRVVGIDHE